MEQSREKIALPVLVNEYSGVAYGTLDEHMEDIINRNVIVIDGDNVWFKQPSSNRRLVRISSKIWNVKVVDNKFTAHGSILTTNEYHAEHYFITNNKVNMLKDSWIYKDKLNYHQHKEY